MKEPHFYSYVGEARPEWGIGEISRYTALFQEAKPNQLCGEASTWYLYSSTAAKQICEYAPDTKCIAILRQPVDRAYSGWSFRVQEGWETLDFEEAIVAEERRIAEGAEWDCHYLHAGLYYQQIRRFHEYIGPDQVRVFWFDDFTTDPDSVVQEIISFLGLNPTKSVDTSTTHNRTSFPRSRTFSWLHAEVVSRLQHAKGIRRVIRQALPASIRTFFRDTIRDWNEKERPPLNPSLRERLTDRVWSNVEQLERLLDVDLSRWK